VKETEIQAAICDYLALKRYFFWRQNNIPAVFTDTHGAMRFRRLPKHQRRGIPDIIIIRKGIGIFLECKTDTGRQSADQA
jgi:hypothetical protein